MSKKLYILDLSGFIFRAYFALPPMTNRQGASTNALFGFIRSVIKLFKDFAPEHIVAVLDGPDNKKQRKEIYEKYKSHRVTIAADLPEQIQEAKKFCALAGIATVEISGVEADDTIGSIATWAAQQEMDVCICTSDKDLAQLVNDKIYLLNPWKENLVIDRQKVEELFGVPPHQIIDLLALMGDASDNIPGVKGFGPKTAVELLKEFGSLDNLLANLDKVKGEKKKSCLTEQKEMALLSYRLATIHTNVDFPKNSSCFKKLSSDVEGLRTFYQAMDFASLLKEMESITGIIESSAQEITSYHIVETEKQLSELIEKLQTAKEICLHVLPVGFSFALEEKVAYYLPLNGPLEEAAVFSSMKSLLENPHLHFFGHNSKLDWHVLKNWGLELKISFDTLIASYLLHSASRSHSLETLVLNHFGKSLPPIKSLIGTGKKEIPLREVPIPQVAAFCCERVDYTFRLKKPLSEQLEKRKLQALFYELEMPLLHVLAKMEHRGIYLDREYLKKLSVEITEEIQALENQIFALSGEQFNLNSPKQLSTILFEKLGIPPLKKTATGLSTRADVLESLAPCHPIVQKIIDYRLVEKLRSTYVDALPDYISPKTQRIHPTFNQGGAATGRLSCQDPNLQNIPVRSEAGRKVRAAFHPERCGWHFLAADYSQIELRLLAHLSNDANLITAFQSGEDIHTYTASLVFNIPLASVTKEMRFRAKAINFGIIYGQQAYGLSQELGVDIAQASAFINAYFERYPSVAHFLQKSIQQAKETGKTVTMLGREREIPEIHSMNASIRQAAERLAMNTPLQGSAADLIKKAMLLIDAELVEREMESFAILQIHDELIFEVPDREVALMSQLVKKHMEGVFSLRVPLVVNVVLGKNWAEC